MAGVVVPSAEARRLVLEGRAPAGMRTDVLDVAGHVEVRELPAGLTCHSLWAGGTSIERLPEDIRVDHLIDLCACRRLTELPARLRVSTLVVRECPSLRALPERMRVHSLDISGCRWLSRWPESAQVHTGYVKARDCTGLRALPQRLGPLSWLDLSGCLQIEAIPPGVKVLSWIDLARTKVRSLPAGLRDVRLRWGGVEVGGRIIFHPETLRVGEVIAEENVEVRRVMIERMGYERFLREGGARIVDEDEDAGGPRQLLRMIVPGDEPVVCVAVRCPSTGNRYLLRVPPEMRTCRQAVAWTAGFDDPAEYCPVVET